MLKVSAQNIKFRPMHTWLEHLGFAEYSTRVALTYDQCLEALFAAQRFALRCSAAKRSATRKCWDCSAGQGSAAQRSFEISCACS